QKTQIYANLCKLGRTGKKQGKMVASNVGRYIYIDKGKMVASNVGRYIYIGKEKLWLSFLKLIVLTLLPTTASSSRGERCIRY
ncbi:hypothetical protein QT982_35335, partial [Microcoleus sp. herbarium2]